jgi:tRNA threonylcarbamoyladenosine biosynthesis protein TsaB
VRILGLETTSPHCSVALVEGERVVASIQTLQPSARAENTLETIDRVMREVGWERGSLARVAVGIGPGSFTGVRVGIAIAEGIATGLSIPLIGIVSLRAMAAGVPASEARLRCPVLDARRNELFVAAYAADGTEKLTPQLLPRADAFNQLTQMLGAKPLLLGVTAREIAEEQDRTDTELTAYPSAACVALAALRETPPAEPVLPLYIRDADVTLPNLPPSPLRQ